MVGYQRFEGPFCLHLPKFDEDKNKSVFVSCCAVSRTVIKHVTVAININLVLCEIRAVDLESM
jgi:hypothetical protein